MRTLTRWTSLIVLSALASAPALAQDPAQEEAPTAESPEAEALPAPVPDRLDDRDKVILGPEPRLHLSAELGSMNYPDPHFELFASSGRLPVRGLRAGVRVFDRAVIEGAWSHGARGASILAGQDTSYDFQDDRGELYTAYYLDAFTLGVRLDLPLARRIVYPFVAGRGALQWQRIRLDDDITDRDSPGQYQTSAVSPGYEVVGGIELRTPQGRGHFAAAWTLELGRAAMQESTFAELGTLTAHGYLVRTGIGVRY